MTEFTPTEMMTIAASRALKNDDVCFVGIGAPSAACNVARLTHAPDITLIYESGTIGTAPDVLPLSIGDGELCETALCTVSVPEMFRYWLMGGRISIGFLGAAQLIVYVGGTLVLMVFGVMITNQGPFAVLHTRRIEWVIGGVLAVGLFGQLAAASLQIATPPVSEMIVVSIRNCRITSRFFAPIARRTPISRVRSITLASMMFMIPIPPTSSEIEAIATITISKMR